MDAFADIAEAAASHHERIDGRGYHRGIGGDLLAEARILAVADVYEALTADRPYRGPMPRETALGILWKDAGTAFDPECVAALQAASAELDAELSYGRRRHRAGDRPGLGQGPCRADDERRPRPPGRRGARPRGPR